MWNLSESSDSETGDKGNAKSDEKPSTEPIVQSPTTPKQREIHELTSSQISVPQSHDKTSVDSQFCTKSHTMSNVGDPARPHSSPGTNKVEPTTYVQEPEQQNERRGMPSKLRAHLCHRITWMTLGLVLFVMLTITIVVLDMYYVM
jgi:hypothetical protein